MAWTAMPDRVATVSTPHDHHRTRLTRRDRMDHLTVLAEALIMDNPMAAPRSREVYGWKPRHAPFIESAQQMFKEWKGA